MQMPRLSLPRLSLGSLGFFAERATLWYGVYTAILFVVFFIATFPYDVAVRRGLAALPQGQVAIEFDDVRFAWHRGLEVSNLRVSDATRAVKAPFVEATRVWIRPDFSQLLRANPYAGVLEAELYGGTASGAVSRGGDGPIRGELRVAGLSLGRVALARAYIEEGALGGRVTGEFVFETSGRDISKVKGDGIVALKGASLEDAKISGFGMPNLHFGEVKLGFGLQGERFEVKEFAAKGKELHVEASGQIGMRDPFAASVLNLKASVEAGNEAPESIRSLLALMPKALPGQEPGVKITGSIQSPKVNPGR